MKKIGLLTMSCIPNYGALLQTYATVETFSKIIATNNYDISIELIDYRPLQQRKRYDIAAQKEYANNLPLSLSKIKNILKVFLLKKTEGYTLWEISGAFRDKIARSKVFNNVGEFDEYDAYLVGSDQTWNPLLSFSLGDDVYLLNFSNSKNKFSYASSIGISSLPLECEDKYTEALSEFKKISVREFQAVDILKGILPNKEINWVIDPTLLINKEEWLKMCKNKTTSEKYLFVYLAKPNDELLLFARKYATENGLKVRITTIPDKYNRKSDLEYIGMLSPEDFIENIENAECVVTNSFHGIAFSINFNKEFFTMYSSEKVTKANDRLKSILALFKLENRILDPSRKKYNPIDWHNVNEILKKQRASSYDYIDEILKCVGEIGNEANM